MTDLERELHGAAKSFAEAVEQQGQSDIAVGKVGSVSLLGSTAGSSVTKVLSEQFRKVGLAVQPKATYEVTGKIRLGEPLPGRNETPAVCVIALELRDQRKDDLLDELEVRVKSVGDVASLGGATASLSPDKGQQERGRELRAAIDPPSEPATSPQGAALDGKTRVMAGPDRPYAMEILVKSPSGDYLPRALAIDEDRRAIASLRRDEVYAVRLINRSPHDAAVRLTIDGINIFDFGDHRGAYTHVIIGEGKSALITGWHRSNAQSDSFLVTEYAKSAASQAGRPESDSGMITAQFCAAWESDADMPPDEKSTRDATGFGPPVDLKYREVRRTIGVERDIITVRYNVPDAPGDLPPP